METRLSQAETEMEEPKNNKVRNYDTFFLSKFNLSVVFMYNLCFSNWALLLFNHDICFSTSSFVLFNLDSRFLSSALVFLSTMFVTKARHLFYSRVTILSFVLKNEWQTENKWHAWIKIYKSTSIHERRAWKKRMSSLITNVGLG